MAKGWDRLDVQGIPPAALEGAFERCRVEFQAILTELCNDDVAVHAAAAQLAGRVTVAAKVRLYTGAARTDADTPSAAFQELAKLRAALDRALKARRELSVRAATIVRLVGEARGVVAPDWRHLEQVLEVLEEAEAAAERMKAIGPDFVLDRLAEIYLELTGRLPPISGSERGPYYRLAKRMLEQVGIDASIVDHAKRWRCSHAPDEHSSP